MNADELLRQYDKVADAPNAIARLRRFILDLAVRGKLVPQDAGDAPASTLLDEIDAKRAELDASRRATIDRSQVDVSEGPFELPRTWVWTRLVRLTSYIQRGKSPKYADSGGSPVVSQKCVQWSGLDLSAARMVTMESLADYDEVRFLRDGDLLWNSTGTGTIGRVVRLIQPPIRLVCDSHVTVVRCLGVVPEYVRTWLRSDHVYGSIEGRAAGSTNQVELTGQMAISQLVPLPPLAEQHRIVAKVDELMVLCDRLEAARAEREAVRDRLTAASLARLNATDPETFTDESRFVLGPFPAITARPDQIKNLRQTIINLAVQGKLCHQVPGDAPASSLLSRIHERRGALSGRKRRLAQKTEAAATAEADSGVPAGWAWTCLGDLALDIRFGTSKKCAHEPIGTPVLRIPNVSGGHVSLADLKFGPLTETEKADLALQVGDLLIIRSNGSLDIVGRAAEVTPAAVGMSFAGYLVRVRLAATEVLPRYIWLCLHSSEVRDQVEKPIRSAVGLKNVNSSEIAALRFRLPPLEEQKRIVARVSELTSLCDRLALSLALEQTRRDQLLEALLRQTLEPVEVMEAVP